MAFTSIHGRRFGFNENGLIFDQRPVGTFPVALGRGNTYFVDSTIAALDGTAPATACATIVAATAKCAANQGDTVIVMPNHVENVAAATALCTVAGVRIIGLGRGVNRPKVTFTAQNTSCYSLAVAGTYIENIVFVANFLSIAQALLLTTAADTVLIDCEFRDTAAATDFLQCVKSTGAANTIDGFTMINCKWIGLGITSVTSMVLSADAISRATFLYNYAQTPRIGTFAALLTLTAGVLLGFEARWNVGITQQSADTGGAFINVGGTTSTGVVANNYLSDLSATDLFMTAACGLSFFENKKTGVIAASGYLLPVTDT